MITKETLEKIESETKGPKTFYETSNLAGENIWRREGWKQREVSILCRPLQNGWKEIFFPSSASLIYSVAIKICSES